MANLHRWICEDPRCNHEMYASAQPDAKRIKWGDNHLCSFIPVPHIAEQPEYELNGEKVGAGGVPGNGLKELIHANYICGSFFDYQRLRAVMMLNRNEEVTFIEGASYTTIKRVS